MEQKNLYKVVCKGMKGSHGTAYVVATDPTEAYRKVRELLDEKELGFSHDREFESITLLAKSVNEESRYTPSSDITALYL